MYLSAGETHKAIEIMGENGWVDMYVLNYFASAWKDIEDGDWNRVCIKNEIK